MGSIANKYANKVYITDDNPRNESPKKIRRTILSKCNKGVEISDRKEAIKLAIKELEKNKILIIAGKGHEKIQVNKQIESKLQIFEQEANPRKKQNYFFLFWDIENINIPKKINASQLFVTIKEMIKENNIAVRY